MEITVLTDKRLRSSGGNRNISRWWKLSVSAKDGAKWYDRVEDGGQIQFCGGKKASLENTSISSSSQHFPVSRLTWTRGEQWKHQLKRSWNKNFFLKRWEKERGQTVTSGWGKAASWKSGFKSIFDINSSFKCFLLCNHLFSIFFPVFNFIEAFNL